MNKKINKNHLKEYKQLDLFFIQGRKKDFQKNKITFY